MKKPIIYAHRGASAYAPENTMAAFRKALDMKAGGIELDVHLSRDGIPIVCHDDKVDRVSNGSGLVREKTLKELKGLDFGSWFSSEYEGEKIPTLEEVLELLEDWDGILNIEIKKAAVQYEGIEEKTVELLRRHNMIDRTIISSFNHYCLLTVKKFEPSLKIGLLYSAGLVEPWVYAKRIGAEAIHPMYLGVVPLIAQGCRDNGIILNAWTADNPEHIRGLAAMGVSGIITNVPDTALEVVSGL
jgi:glycerophosphoryl diester phosphodiesterase